LNQKKNNEKVSLKKYSLENIHRSSEDSQMIEQVLAWHKHESKSVSHPMSTVTGVSISNTNNKMDEYFVDSESIITNEQRSPELEQQNPEMNHSSLEFQEVTHAVGMLVRERAQ
jgi:hypothetical protein